ncbi:hypothetical protein KIN20_018683 [Parelaphostrongylus tenuis]|uniref:Uncharacterized protein n=1 Tax=Parelaphostrongylus tenuis TaxID=148309 RepID=A0AAD5MJS7_PARTN|nr:hypothetical protein KIN20_018683 [Parelaphostrongylus tenuis]
MTLSPVKRRFDRIFPSTRMPFSSQTSDFITPLQRDGEQLWRCRIAPVETVYQWDCRHFEVIDNDCKSNSGNTLSIIS